MTTSSPPATAGARPLTSRTRRHSGGQEEVRNMQPTAVLDRDTGMSSSRPAEHVDAAGGSGPEVAATAPGAAAPGAAVPAGTSTPCRAHDAELWFAQVPSEVEEAKALCRECPVRALCLAGAVERGEPWGVWGGELFEHGLVVPRKRPRGRPRKNEAA